MKIFSTLVVICAMLTGQAASAQDTTVWNGRRWTKGLPQAQTWAVLDTGTIYATQTQGGFTCRALLLNPQAQLLVKGGQRVSVELDIALQPEALLRIADSSVVSTQQGNVNNEGTIELTGGSLVQLNPRSAFNGGGGFVQIQQNPAPSGSIPPIWSAPVRNFALSNFQFVPEFLPYQADPATNTIGLQISPVATPGAGYMGYLPAQVRFEGAFNTGDIDLPLQDFTSCYFLWAYTMLGNPYPSALDVEAFIRDNANVILDGNVWVWDTEKQQVVLLNKLTPRRLSPGQGFFVQISPLAAADPSNLKIRFRNAHRTNQSARFYRTEQDFSTLRLTLRHPAGQDQVALAVGPQFGPGPDQGYDGPKVAFAAQPVYLALQPGQAPMASLAVAEVRELPLRVRVSQTGTYHWQAEAGQGWLLLDRHTGRRYPLAQVQALYLTAGEHAHRFSLLQATGTAEHGLAEPQVYAVGSRVVINPPAHFGQAAQAQLFTLYGELLGKQTVANGRLTEWETPVTRSGIYLIKLENEGQVSTVRVWLEAR
ncbi:MAG: hypothetical protein MUC97_12715 [Bernardetiaceae bacterium]|nr:hypothetical protein [Bernardetiaceae bacterium]